MLAGDDKVGSLVDVEFTLVWCGSLADSLLQLSFVLALIEFSFKRCLSLFDCFVPAALSRFGTLVEFGSSLLARWPIVELACSINLPLTMTLTKVHSLSLELEIKTNKSYKSRSKLDNFDTKTSGPLHFFFKKKFTW